MNIIPVKAPISQFEILFFENGSPCPCTPEYYPPDAKTDKNPHLIAQMFLSIKDHRELIEKEFKRVHNKMMEEHAIVALPVVVGRRSLLSRLFN